jgi:hypothetical protein
VTIRATRVAVLNRLKANPDLTAITFEGVVASRPQKYVTVFMDNGFRESERVTARNTRATFTVTVHSVGSTPEQVQWVAERVFAQLVNWTPSIEGRRSSRSRHVVSRPIDVDTGPNPPAFFSVDQFEIETSPL